MEHGAYTGRQQKKKAPPTVAAGAHEFVGGVFTEFSAVLSCEVSIEVEVMEWKRENAGQQNGGRNSLCFGDPTSMGKGSNLELLEKLIDAACDVQLFS